MTAPDPLGYEVQSRYAKKIGDQLIHTLPAGWDYAQVHFREIDGYAETNAIVHTVTGKMEPWSPPQPVADLFHELRAATRGSAEGPWFSARFEIKFNGEQKLHMNRTDEPKWINPPPPEAYQEELRLAGGDPAALPEWLRSKLS
jgi:hypothetical protein